MGENIKHRAIKYRIYPNKQQKDFFMNNFGCVRFVYNNTLNYKKDEYAKGNSVSMIEAINRIVSLKKMDDYDWLKDADSASLQQSVRHLFAAFNNFYAKRARFPKYKSRKAEMSYTTPYNNGAIRIEGNYIKLPKVKVKASIHRLAPKEWKLKSATVSKTRSDRYYVSLLYEVLEEENKKAPDYSNAIGLDYKSDGLYCDSFGDVCGSPKYFRKAHKKLARQQKKLSRMQGSRKGEAKSKNYLKQLNKVSRIYEHVSNQRKDFLHKKSLEIANLYDVVCVESLNMRALSNKGFGNGKATMDNGFGMFLSMLEYKLNERGKILIKVSKWYASSQICSNCGGVKKMPLKERTYVCPKCGFVIDRDYNAAINIREEGLRLLSL